MPEASAAAGNAEPPPARRGSVPLFGLFGLLLVGPLWLGGRWAYRSLAPGVRK